MTERTLAAVWVLIGAVGARMAWDMGLVGPGGPDSGLFPFIASFGVLAGGLALTLSPRLRADGIEWPDRAGWMRLAGVVAGLATIALALPRAGFVVAGLVTMMILMRAVERAGWLQAALLSAGSVTAVVLVFGRLLGMPLPRGPWGF
jgi:putative tricarboxylic transport membrane protein